MLPAARLPPCHARGTGAPPWPTPLPIRCRLLLPPTQQPERPALTPRELEVLRWTMDGKTAWEVGAVLGISERTVVFHVNNASHKLGCINKQQAVLKALRLGLIN